LATLTVDEETGLPICKIFKPHEIDAGMSRLLLILPCLYFHRNSSLVVSTYSSREGRIGKETRGRSDRFCMRLDRNVEDEVNANELYSTIMSSCLETSVRMGSRSRGKATETSDAKRPFLFVSLYVSLHELAARDCRSVSLGFVYTDLSLFAKLFGVMTERNFRSLLLPLHFLPRQWPNSFSLFSRG